MIIKKRAIRMGNSAAVYLPKKYENAEIVIHLPEGIEEVRQRAIELLLPHLGDVLGAYIFGSWAREEQETDSDIDILVILGEKQEIKNPYEDIDLRIATLESVERSIENYPAMIMPLLKEANVIINPKLLAELRGKEIDVRKFEWSFEEAKSMLGIVKSSLEMDRKAGTVNLDLVYSLILRLRTAYAIESLIKDKVFSNFGVKKIASDYGLNESAYNRLYRVYRQVRDNKRVAERVKIEEIEHLLEIVKNYLNKVENEAKKEIEKRDKKH